MLDATQSQSYDLFITLLAFLSQPLIFLTGGNVDLAVTMTLFILLVLNVALFMWAAGLLVTLLCDRMADAHVRRETERHRQTIRDAMAAHRLTDGMLRDYRDMRRAARKRDAGSRLSRHEIVLLERAGQPTKPLITPMDTPCDIRAVMPITPEPERND